MKATTRVTALAAAIFGVATNAYAASAVAADTRSVNAPEIPLSKFPIPIGGTEYRVQEHFARVGKTDPFTDSW